jgi:O-succinylbenzoic acid--CoA ligase
MSIQTKSLYLGGKVIPFGSLRRENPADYEINARTVLTFCSEWLGGRERFEIRTSGSTGQPKEIVLSRLQMTQSATLTQQALDLREGMTALLCLDPALIAGKMMMVRCLVTGMNLVVTTPTANPLDFVPPELHIHFAAMVPLQAQTIISSGKYPDFRTINKVILGSGEVSRELTSSIQNMPTEFYATFGMTETVSHIALRKLNGAGRVEYFETLRGVEVTLDDRGCLVIHAKHLGSQSIVTNDLAKLLGPNRFIWLGRHDNIINTGGIKVIPEEVEKQIAMYFLANGINNKFFVASVPGNVLGQEVVVIVEGGLTEESEKKILNDLKQSLEKYKAPRQVLYSSRFQMTSMGKIKRKETLAAASPRPGQ